MIRETAPGFGPTPDPPTHDGSAEAPRCVGQRHLRPLRCRPCRLAASRRTSSLRFGALGGELRIARRVAPIEAPTIT